MLHLRFLLIALLGLQGCSSCNTKAPVAKITAPAEITGRTMGTTYSIKLRGEITPAELTNLKIKIVQRLQDINVEMSTYMPHSHISKFNQSKVGTLQQLPPDMNKVVHKALEIGGLSNGAFDITIDPLINLWGFDKDGRRKTPPTEDEIAKLKKQTGVDKIALKGNVLKKLHPKASINLSSIAKGFAVDAVSELITQAGYFEHMVEIGGEVRVSTQSQTDKPWSIAIVNPLTPNINKALGVLELRNRALASSGTYLNFFETNGKKYAHVINPKTGQAIQTNLIGVSILAPDAMSADSLATTALVMGEKAFRALLLSRPGVEALFIYVNETGDAISLSNTKGFILQN